MTIELKHPMNATIAIEDLAKVEAALASLSYWTPNPEEPAPASAALAESDLEQMYAYF